MKSDNIIVDKSKIFAIKIINLYKYLFNEKHEFILSKQMLRSGTNIGANVKEAIRGQRRADFISKMNISLKEASETEYWLELLKETEYITNGQFEIVYGDCLEIIKILTTIINSSKVNNKNNYAL